MADAKKTLSIILQARDEASAKLKGVEANARKVGKAFVAIGAVSTAGLVAATKTSIDFESAFAGVRKTVDASEEEFEQIERNFRDIALAAPVAATELSRIGELAGQLGVSGVDNITKFSRVMADMSVTTNLTSEDAATSFARIANIMQEPIENVDRMGASVVDLGNNFATTEAEIVEFANRIAGAGKIAGLSTDEIFGIGAAMSSVGVQPEAGGTAVQKVLIQMNTAVAQGNEDLAVFAETAGLTIKEFEDLSGIERFNNFVMGLGEQGDDAINTLAELGLEDQRLIRSFLSLANAGDLVIDAAERSTMAWQENTALTEEARKRYETTASQIQLLKNNLTELGLIIGEVLLPILNRFIQEVLIPIITRFNEFAQQHPTLVAGLLAIGSVLGVVGAVLLVLGPIVAGIGATIGVLTTIVGAASTAFMVIVGILGGPVTLIILAVIALVGALWLAWQNNFLNIRDHVNNFVNWLKGPALNNLRAWGELVKSVVAAAKAAWVTAIGAMTGAISGLISKIKSAISALRELASTRSRGGGGSFQHGGFVPGAGHQAVPAILHGGERIIPRTGTDVNPSGGGGASVTINFTGPVSMDSKDRVDELAKRIINIMGRQNEIAAKGLAI